MVLSKPVKLYECRNKEEVVFIINLHSFLAGMWWQVLQTNPRHRLELKVLEMF